MPGTSEVDFDYIVNLMKWIKHGRILVWGVDDDIPFFDEQSISMVDNEDSVTNINECVHFSAETQQMHDDDANFAKYNQLLLSQQDQHDVIEELVNSDEACDQKAIGLLWEGLKIGTGNKRVQDFIIKGMEAFYYSITEFAASEKGIPNSSQGIHLSQSGTSNRNIEKRNKSQYYKWIIVMTSNNMNINMFF